MRLLWVGGAIALGSVASAQETAQCRVTDQSEVIRVAYCEGDAPAAELAAFGQSACEGVLPCGVWFWVEDNQPPSTAPLNHDGLTEAEVASARAVWVEENEQLIEISVAE